MILKYFIHKICYNILRSLKNVFLNFKIFKKYDIYLSHGEIINNPDNIEIGHSFNISPYCQLFAQGHKGGAYIEIGNNVALNFNVMINADCGGYIKIGNDVLIGPYTVMRASNHKFDDVEVPINKQGHKPGNIIIEDDVWLGGHVTVLPNVTIGRSSIIGAGSVVKSDVKPYSIVGGIPAKFIRSRKVLDE